MITCAGCKHWDDGGLHDDVMAHMGIETRQVVGVCQKFKDTRDPGPIVFAEYGYAVLTSASFGCVLGQARAGH